MSISTFNVQCSGRGKVYFSASTHAAVQGAVSRTSARASRKPAAARRRFASSGSKLGSLDGEAGFGSILNAMRTLLARYSETFRPGDVFLVNDPFDDPFRGIIDAVPFAFTQFID